MFYVVSVLEDILKKKSVIIKYAYYLWPNNSYYKYKIIKIYNTTCSICNPAAACNPATVCHSCMFLSRLVTRIVQSVEPVIQVLKLRLPCSQSTHVTGPL